MRSARWFAAIAGCGLAVLLALAARSVMPAAAQVEPPRLGAPQSPFDSPDQDPQFAARRRKALNEARQKALVSDTEKLLQLTRQLDAEVQNGGADRLTDAQVARLGQIEKLAHRVKDKMTESDADTPNVRPLFSPRYP